MAHRPIESYWRLSDFKLLPHPWDIDMWTFSKHEVFQNKRDVKKYIGRAMFIVQATYRTRAIITRSWFEITLDYKPRILDPKIEEFPCL